MTGKTHVPSEYFPQFCQSCVTLTIDIRGTEDGEVRWMNEKMNGMPIAASSETSADYIFMCPECDNSVLINETEET